MIRMMADAERIAQHFFIQRVKIFEEHVCAKIKAVTTVHLS